MSEPVLIWIDPVQKLPEGTPAPQERLSQKSPREAALLVTDLSVTRGDGIFETIGARNGKLQAVQPHLRRLQRSADMLDLPQLDLKLIEEASQLAVARHDDVPEVQVKIVVTRGVEGTSTPTAWAYAFEADPSLSAKREGIKVARLDRGYRSDAAQTSPWLLQGAKTLSYAVNMAALREATRRGADDVIFTSIDGFVLECPRSTVVARIGNTFVTPPVEHGILAGTTQEDLFVIVEEMGYATDQRPVKTEELDSVDALWIVSSGQQISPVLELDGRRVPQDPELSAALLDKLLARKA